VRFRIGDREEGSLMKGQEEGRVWELKPGVEGGGGCWLIALAYLSALVQREPLNDAQYSRVDKVTN